MKERLNHTLQLKPCFSSLHHFVFLRELRVICKSRVCSLRFHVQFARDSR